MYGLLVLVFIQLHLVLVKLQVGVTHFQLQDLVQENTMDFIINGQQAMLVIF